MSEALAVVEGDAMKAVFAVHQPAHARNGAKAASGMAGQIVGFTKVADAESRKSDR